MHLFVAILCYSGWVHNRCMQSILELFSDCIENRREMKFSLGILPGEIFVGHGRNRLTQIFLESTATHMLMLDTDIAFKPKHVFRMLDFDVDVVGGSYSYRKFPPERVGDLDADFPEGINGFRRATVVPAGFMLIKHEAIEKMVKVFPDQRYVDDGKMYDGLWNTCFDQNSRMMGEDTTFCARVLASGLEVWVDLESKVSHIGEFSFELP